MSVIWLPSASHWVKPKADTTDLPLVKLVPEQIWCLLQICFKSFTLPVLCNLVNGIKSIYIVTPFSDSCTHLYAEFLPHMASASSVEATEQSGCLTEMIWLKRRYENCKNCSQLTDYRVRGNEEHLITRAFSVWKWKHQLSFLRKKGEDISQIM